MPLFKSAGSLRADKCAIVVKASPCRARCCETARVVLTGVTMRTAIIVAYGRSAH
jgi:hypothetical protein